MPAPTVTALPLLLIADSDRVFARSLAARLDAERFSVISTDTVAALDTALTTRDVALLIVEPEMLGSRDDAAKWLSALRQTHRRTAVIVLTAHGSIAAAVELTRGPAFVANYLTKPLSDETLVASIDRALRKQQLTSEADRDDRPNDRLGDVLGRDRKMTQLFDLVDAVADSRSTVLIVGESGTGKSMLARAIHARSQRAGRPFVEVACGSLPETLLEGELFGHVKGAFTGAIADKRGRFAAADTGTIFLDEVNSATPLMQVKLLRVLQEHAFEPVGSNDTKNVDVRTILATNADLGTLVARGEFRQDLFYRVNVVTLQLPPLRDRIGDVPLLAEFFLDKYRRESGRQTIGFSEDAMASLQRYAWPGNVRELENVVERAVVLSRKAVIELGDLPESVTSYVPPSTSLRRRADDALGTAMPLEVALQVPERRIIEAALERNAWSRVETAKELGIDRTTLYKKMRKHGIGGDRHAA